MRKLFQKNSNRLTAAEARAIPVDDKIVTQELDTIYNLVRTMARCGEHAISWSYLTYSNEQAQIIKARLVEDGYNIKEVKGLFSWLISW